MWRQRLASLHSRLEIMRWNSLRMLTTADQPELSGASYISKLYWARLHRDIGETWVDLAGEAALAFEPTAAELAATDGGEAYPLTDAQRLFLYTRADTIYGGANQIQRNIIGERALGLPRRAQGHGVSDRVRPVGSRRPMTRSAGSHLGLRTWIRGSGG